MALDTGRNAPSRGTARCIAKGKRVYLAGCYIDLIKPFYSVPRKREGGGFGGGGGMKGV